MNLLVTGVNPPSGVASGWYRPGVRRLFMTLALTSLGSLALTGCTGDEPATADDVAAVQEPAPDEAGPEEADGAPLAHLSSCDDVGAVLADHIADLEPDEGNVVDEWGVTCLWESPETATDPSLVRSVEVGMVANESAEPPALDLLRAMDGFQEHADPAVTEAGGVAYSLTLGAEIVESVVTTVWFPGVEVTVSGGAAANASALDGPTAVGVALRLLGR